MHKGIRVCPPNHFASQEEWGLNLKGLNLKDTCICISDRITSCALGNPQSAADSGRPAVCRSMAGGHSSPH